MMKEEKKNAPIYTIDNMLNKGQLKFSEACQCYRLIRKGRSTEEALHIINERKLKKEEKKQMKNKKKNNKDLNQLLMELENQIKSKFGGEWLVSNEALGFDVTLNWEGDESSCEYWSSCEGVNPSPLVDQDTKDLLESNQDSLGMWS